MTSNIEGSIVNFRQTQFVEYIQSIFFRYYSNSYFSVIIYNTFEVTNDETKNTRLQESEFL